MKITDYPKVTSFDDGDVILKDGVSGTKRVEVSDLTYMLFDNIPEMHNKIYRGKNLGTSVSFQQWEAIETGTFKDLWIGDFWVTGGNTWIISDFNYFLSYEGIDGKPHVVLTRENVHSTNTLYDKKVPEDIDFYSSNLYSELKRMADDNYKKQFNNRLLSYTVFRQPKHTGGVSQTSRRVEDVYITIPTQTQMLGHEFTRPLAGDSNYQSQTGYGCQFALFELAYQEMIRRYERRGLNDTILLDSYGPNGTVATIVTKGGYQSYRSRADNGKPWQMIPTIVIG